MLDAISSNLNTSNNWYGQQNQLSFDSCSYAFFYPSERLTALVIGLVYETCEGIFN